MNPYFSKTIICIVFICASPIALLPMQPNRSYINPSQEIPDELKTEQKVVKQTDTYIDSVLKEACNFFGIDNTRNIRGRYMYKIDDKIVQLQKYLRRIKRTKQKAKNTIFTISPNQDDVKYYLEAPKFKQPLEEIIETYTKYIDQLETIQRLFAEPDQSYSKLFPLSNYFPDRMKHWQKIDPKAWLLKQYDLIILLTSRNHTNTAHKYTKKIMPIPGTIYILLVKDYGKANSKNRAILKNIGDTIQKIMISLVYLQHNLESGLSKPSSHHQRLSPRTPKKAVLVFE